MIFVAVALLLIAEAGANSCSNEPTCKACLSNKSCGYVLARAPGDASNSYMCVNNIDTRRSITVALRIRDHADCETTEDTTKFSETEEINPSGRTKLPMLMTAASVECPSVTPLMIAFFVLSLLLAVVVSVVTTIACWVSCCGGDDTGSRYTRSPSIPDEHELTPKV